MKPRLLKSHDFGSLIRAPNHCFETIDSQKFQSFSKQWFESAHHYRVLFSIYHSSSDSYITIPVLVSSSSSSLMLPSRAIGNFLFPTYEVVITSLSYSSALMSERIKCSIPLVDNHINIHRAIHAVCWQFWNFGQIHVNFTAYKTNNMLWIIVHI